jgi:hypothetical protein
MSTHSLRQEKPRWQRERSKPKPARIRQIRVYVRLEPYEGKLSRTVLRREGRSNPPDLAANHKLYIVAVKLVFTHFTVFGFYQAIRVSDSHQRFYLGCHIGISLFSRIYQRDEVCTLKQCDIDNG